LNRSLEKANIKLVGVKNNLIDSVWGSDCPDRPNQSVVPLEIKFTGKSWETKVEFLSFLTHKAQGILYTLFT
jgi:hypothetical protein